MENKEALKILKQQVKFYSCSLGDCFCEHKEICDRIFEENKEPSCKGQTVYQANQVAIMALEKQIKISRIVKRGRYYCPKCNTEMKKSGYCSCGQKLY